MEDKVLVVGATGTVGREVVRALQGSGARVKAASRSATDVPGGEATKFDLGEPSTWEPALRAVDRIFLLAPTQLLSRADELVLPLVHRLRAAGVRRIVCMTALTADRPGVPMNAIELAIRASRIEYTLLRPNWFNQNFVPGYYLAMINNAGGLFLPAGDEKVSFVDARDIGAVAAAALTRDGHGGREYTITGPEALSHAEACAILSKVAGRQIRYADIPDSDFRGALHSQGMPPDAIEELSRLYSIVRDGSCAVVSDDVAAVLGRPPISFEQFANDHAALLR